MSKKILSQAIKFKIKIKGLEGACSHFSCAPIISRGGRHPQFSFWRGWSSQFSSLSKIRKFRWGQSKLYYFILHYILEKRYMKAVFKIQSRLLNPIPAGVLENQDVLCPNMTNDTSLESSWDLLLESAKKFANLRKLNFLSQNQVL